MAPQQILIDQPHGLRPALAVRGAEMHVENVQQMRAYAEVGTKHAAFLPVRGHSDRRDGSIRTATGSASRCRRRRRDASGSRQSRERIRDAPQGSLLDDPESNGPRGSPPPAALRCRRRSLEYARNAFDSNSAIQSPALVNIVSGNPESDSYLHLIFDQRRQHLFNLLPCAAPFPTGKLDALAEREIGVEDCPELLH